MRRRFHRNWIRRFHRLNPVHEQAKLRINGVQIFLVTRDDLVEIGHHLILMRDVRLQRVDPVDQFLAHRLLPLNRPGRL